MTTTLGWRLPDWLVHHAVIALLGEITSNIRAIALGYNPPDMTLRVYLDDPPTGDDKERFEIVLIEILSGTQTNQIVGQNLELRHGLEPTRSLDPLDGWVYIRHDPSLRAT